MARPEISQQQPPTGEQQRPQDPVVRRTSPIVDTTKRIGRRVVVGGLVPFVAAGAFAAACRQIPERSSDVTTPPGTHQTVKPSTSPSEKLYPPEPGPPVQNEVPLHASPSVAHK